MSTIKANTLSNVAGSQSISTDRVAQGTAFAWVNFNGTGTVAIRASYNVSSITDNGGAGDYTINFTTAAADANYAWATAGGVSNGYVVAARPDLAVPTTTALRISSYTAAAAATDAAYICAVVYR